MFLRGACPVHGPDRCAEPGKLYWDAHWPSDQYPLQDPDGHGFSVAFIPGRLSDHNLLDDKYVYLWVVKTSHTRNIKDLAVWSKISNALKRLVSGLIISSHSCFLKPQEHVQS